MMRSHLHLDAYGVVAPGTIAAPEAADTNTPSGFLSRVKGVLDGAGRGLDVIGSSIFDRVTENAPELKTSASFVAQHAPDIADAAMLGFADRTLEAMRFTGVGEDQIQKITDGLEEYWTIDSRGNPVKKQGGGADFLHRVIASDPRFQRAAQRALNGMFVTRLYDQLGKTSKVLVWLSALGGAAPSLVRRTQSTLPTGQVVSGWAVEIPGVGSTVVDELGVKNLSTSIGGTLGRLGIRGRTVSGRVSAGYRRSSGKSSVSTGLSVPVARRSRMEMSISAERQAGRSPDLNLGLQYSTPISPTSQIMARAGISAPVRMHTRGGRVSFEPNSSPTITLGLSGPLPTFSRRVNQARSLKIQRENEKDQMARRMVRERRENPDTEQPWTYQQFMQLPIASARETFLSSSRAPAVSGTMGRAIGPPCMAWIDYMRMYHPTEYRSDWYTAYENAPMELQDECARVHDKRMEVDAFRRNKTDPKEYAKLRKEFIKRAKREDAPSTLSPSGALARAIQIQESERSIALMGAVQSPVGASLRSGVLLSALSPERV
jgi:hypothetical protein